MKVELLCKNCGDKFEVFPSRIGKAQFCDKSCLRSFRNKVDNPSKNRDVSGAKNPMYGKHPDNLVVLRDQAEHMRVHAQEKNG